jgi:hypothetical protein
MRLCLLVADEGVGRGHGVRPGGLPPVPPKWSAPRPNSSHEQLTGSAWVGAFVKRALPNQL